LQEDNSYIYGLNYKFDVNIGKTGCFFQSHYLAKKGNKT